MNDATDTLSRLLQLYPVRTTLDIRCHFGAPWQLPEPPSAPGVVRYHMIVSGDASDSFSASKFSSFSNLFLFFLYLCGPSVACLTRPSLVCIRDSASFGGILPELFALEADAEIERDLGNVFL